MADDFEIIAEQRAATAFGQTLEAEVIHIYDRKCLLPESAEDMQTLGFSLRCICEDGYRHSMDRRRAREVANNLKAIYGNKYAQLADRLAKYADFLDETDGDVKELQEEFHE